MSQQATYDELRASLPVRQRPTPGAAIQYWARTTTTAWAQWVDLPHINDPPRSFPCSLYRLGSNGLNYVGSANVNFVASFCKGAFPLYALVPVVKMTMHINGPRWFAMGRGCVNCSAKNGSIQSPGGIIHLNDQPSSNGWPAAPAPRDDPNWSTTGSRVNYRWACMENKFYPYFTGCAFPP